MHPWIDYCLSGEGAISLTCTSFCLIFFYLQFKNNAIKTSQEEEESVEKNVDKKTTSRIAKDDKEEWVHMEKNTCIDKTRQVFHLETVMGNIQIIRINPSSSQGNLFTLHDFGINSKSCFTPFFQKVKETRPFSILCQYHIELPGVQDRMEENIIMKEKVLSWTSIVEMIEQVRQHFKMERFLVFGVGMGSDAFLRYAIQYPSRVEGMILSGMNRQPASSSEAWTWTMMRNLLHYSGPTSQMVKTAMSYFLFSSDFVSSQPRIVDGYLQGLPDMHMGNFVKIMTAYATRTGIPKTSFEIITNVPLILFAAGQSPCSFPFLQFPSEDDNALELLQLFNRKSASWMKIRESGRMITAERPGELIQPIMLFLNGLGYM